MNGGISQAARVMASAVEALNPVVASLRESADRFRARGEADDADFSAGLADVAKSYGPSAYFEELARAQAARAAR